MAEAMSEEAASSWYDDAPITDEQIESVRRDLDSPPAERGAAFAPFVVRKMLAELDRLRAQVAEIGNFTVQVDLQAEGNNDAFLRFVRQAIRLRRGYEGGEER